MRGRVNLVTSTPSRKKAPAVLPQSNDECWCGSGRKYKRCHKGLEGRITPGIISPMRAVPEHIVKPPYAATGEVPRWNESKVKSPEIIEKMRYSCDMATDILRLAGEYVQVGMTTNDIDIFVHDLTIERGAYPSPLNYHHYPKSVCTSLNEVICHGIPDDTVIEDGDIINLDVTCYVNGVHGDTNATFFVGNVSDVDRNLVKVTEECLWLGIGAVKPDRPLSDIGKAIEDHATAHRLGVVRAFIGHGIGEQFHSDVQVLHYFDARNNMLMKPGMVFTIEPMITLGTYQFHMWDDDWTAVTADGKRTAQFEHTILVTETGCEVLTGGDKAVSPRKPSSS